MEFFMNPKSLLLTAGVALVVVIAYDRSKGGRGGPGLKLGN